MPSLTADPLGLPTLIAGIGPLSSLVETLATTVGAGLVLGGFVMGAIGLFAQVRPTRTQLSDAGYFGGLIATACVVRDACLFLL